MAGATLAGLGGSYSRRFSGEPWPRRDFGTRVVARGRFRDSLFAGAGTCSVDYEVADMRRRIDASQRAWAGRLAWAIGGALIGGGSLALWLNPAPVATTLARALARLL